MTTTSSHRVWFIDGGNRQTPRRSAGTRGSEDHTSGPNLDAIAVAEATSAGWSTVDGEAHRSRADIEKNELAVRRALDDGVHLGESIMLESKVAFVAPADPDELADCDRIGGPAGDLDPCRAG